MIDISDKDGEERSQTSAEWQLNTSRLVGEVNDGIPPFFTPAETEFMLVEGAKHKVKYKPAPGAKRKSKQQQRTARWRSNKRQQSIRDAVCPTWRQGKKPSATDPPAGIKKYMKKLQPSVLELQARVSKDWSKLKKGHKKSKINISAQQYLQETQREEKRVNELLKDWSRDGHGHFELKKAAGNFRLVWENFDSLCILTDERNLTTVRGLDVTRKRLSADMIAGCKTQTNWYQVLPHHRFDRLVGMGVDQRFIAAHNVHDNTRCQPGGTLIAAYGRAVGFGSVEVGKDETGLGRWTWMKFTTDGLVRRFVSAYRLKIPSTLKRRGLDWKGTTVYEQHYRYYRTNNYPVKYPLHNFDNDLLEQLSSWIMQGEELVLMMDMNDDIYKSPFARKLAKIGLEEQFRKTNSADAPHSHAEGSKPISAVLATQGIDVQNYFQFKHGVGTGNHRVHALDITLQSIYGTSAPPPVKKAGRKLQCSQPRTVQAYIDKLEILTDEHKLDKKLDFIAQEVSQGAEQGLVA